MTQFLLRHFVPQYDRTEDPQVRRRYGALSGTVGILLNGLLFVFKYLAGVLTGSIAITADAFNNLSDAGSSLITLLGFRLASLEPDPHHPFGHGRLEYLSGLAVAALILFMGLELLKSSVVKIFHPEAIRFSALSLVILLLSILVKLWLGRFNKVLSKRIGSAAMAATAADSLSDALSTAAVLAGTLIGSFTSLRVDGWLGLLVAFFILRAGWEAAKETISPLLGQPADPDFVKAIVRTVKAHPEVMGVHDLVVHDYGPGRRMITLHAEVPADGDILEIHDVIDCIEHELKQKFGCSATIHMDPLVRNDKAVLAAREKVMLAVRAVDARISIHDFRIVPGPTHTNCIFDALLPFEVALSEEQAADAIAQALRDIDPSYQAVITIDRGYLG